MKNSLLILMVFVFFRFIYVEGASTKIFHESLKPGDLSFVKKYTEVFRNTNINQPQLKIYSIKEFINDIEKNLPIWLSDYLDLVKNSQKQLFEVIDFLKKPNSLIIVNLNHLNHNKKTKIFFEEIKENFSDLYSAVEKAYPHHNAYYFSNKKLGEDSLKNLKKETINIIYTLYNAIFNIIIVDYLFRDALMLCDLLLNQEKFLTGNQQEIVKHYGDLFYKCFKSFGFFPSTIIPKKENSFNLIKEKFFKFFKPHSVDGSIKDIINKIDNFLKYIGPFIEDEMDLKNQSNSKDSNLLTVNNPLYSGKISLASVCYKTQIALIEKKYNKVLRGFLSFIMRKYEDISAFYNNREFTDILSDLTISDLYEIIKNDNLMNCFLHSQLIKYQKKIDNAEEITDDLIDFKENLSDLIETFSHRVLTILQPYENKDLSFQMYLKIMYSLYKTYKNKANTMKEHYKYNDLFLEFSRVFDFLIQNNITVPIVDQLIFLNSILILTKQQIKCIDLISLCIADIRQNIDDFGGFINDKLGCILCGKTINNNQVILQSSLPEINLFYKDNIIAVFDKIASLDSDKLEQIVPLCVNIEENLRKLQDIIIKHFKKHCDSFFLVIPGFSNMIGHISKKYEDESNYQEWEGSVLYLLNLNNHTNINNYKAFLKQFWSRKEKNLPDALSAFWMEKISKLIEVFGKLKGLYISKISNYFDKYKKIQSQSLEYYASHKELFDFLKKYLNDDYMTDKIQQQKQDGKSKYQTLPLIKCIFTDIFRCAFRKNDVFYGFIIFNIDRIVDLINIKNVSSKEIKDFEGLFGNLLKEFQSNKGSFLGSIVKYNGELKSAKAVFSFVKKLTANNEDFGDIPEQLFKNPYYLSVFLTKMILYWYDDIIRKNIIYNQFEEEVDINKLKLSVEQLKKDVGESEKFVNALYNGVKN